MNRLIIDKETQVEVKTNTLVIEGSKVPLMAVNIIYLHHKAQISLKEITKITKAGIPLVIISSKPKEFIQIQKR